MAPENGEQEKDYRKENTQLTLSFCLGQISAENSQSTTRLASPFSPLPPSSTSIETARLLW